MPRRRQGHFHVVRRANATSKARNTIYNEEGKLSQPESASVEVEEQCAVPPRAKDGAPKVVLRIQSSGTQPPKDEVLWKVSESLVPSGKEDGFHYLHKKFKKMEAPSEEDAAYCDWTAKENGGDSEEEGAAENEERGAGRPANLSLEALFQVTGHELQRMKSSEEASSPESIPAESRPARAGSEHKRKSPPADEEEEAASRECGAPPTENGLEERELAKRLRLGKHVCPYCGLACGKPSVLQKHVRAHTNERPYPCVACGFAFKTKSNLYKHCKSRAHHLKVASREEEEGGATGPAAAASASLLDLDEADVIETDDSTNSERESDEDAPPVSTSIYKPKFHSVAYNAPSPRRFAAIATCVSPGPAQGFEPPSNADKRYGPPVSLDRNNGAVQKEEGGATVVGLAKRRNELFQLRLEIPTPRSVHVDACLPSLTSSSSSSSSATSISTLPHRLPASAAIGTLPRGSHKSPKLASPEYLQQHISNLISQNAAIVETLDPLWPRRYTRQSSVASSHNVDAELRPKERRDDPVASSAPVTSSSPAKSKLALALLAAASPPAATARHSSDVETVLYRPPLSGCNVIVPAPSSAAGSAFPVTYHRPATLVAGGKEPAGDGRLPTPDVDSGSIVKTLLMAAAPKGLAAAKERVPEVHHPQNPEGSIIKDLLLKTRPTAAATTCMRLSGGSISTSDVEAAPPKSDAGDDAGPYTCSLCNISYRKVENLEIHRTHYCQKSPRPSAPTGTSGGTFVLPSPAADLLQPTGDEMEAAVTVILAAGLEAAIGAGSIPMHGCIAPTKPRGRPRGSKNRPKFEAPAALVGRNGTAGRLTVRIHSKSVSECALEPAEGPDGALDALKLRRNSISGELSDSIKGMLMARRTLSSPTDAAELESGWKGGGGDDGPILKKHLLSGGGLEGDKSPPLKKRKIPEDVLLADVPVPKKDVATVLSLKSLEHLSKYPMRPSAVRLFGGEVQICDGAETKKIIIDSKMQSVPAVGAALHGTDTTSSVVATIAKPVHNSGGTVLQVQEAKSSVCIPVVSLGRPLMATGTASSRSALTDTILLPAAASHTFAIDISRLKLNQVPSVVKPPATVLPPFFLRPSGTALVVDEKTLADCGAASLPGPSDAQAPPLADPGKSKRLEVPIISVQSPDAGHREVTAATATTTTTTTAKKSSLLSPPRPTSLALKNVHTSMVGMTLVSPETPRPKKKYGQCYHNGQYYTYLELKQSTRVYYCNCRPQPMYVPQSVDPKLSMYSMWQTVPAEPDPFGLTPPQAMSLYASKPRYQAYSIAGLPKLPLVVTHSSYWTFQQKEKKGADDVAGNGSQSQEDPGTEADEECEPLPAETGADKNSEDEDDEMGEGKEKIESPSLPPPPDDEEVDVERTTPSPLDPKPKGDISLKQRLKDVGTANVAATGAVEPKRVKIFEGGFKSNEDYTYVRGRGRGKYLCEECGIRCKKPSMLKKHIRTHTDVRPYACKHCNFSFKTKGNLTKHMKSKAHHKKCVVLGIVPVPVTIDDAQIDEEALARQERIEHQRKQFADDDEDSALDDDEDDEDDDDEEEEDDAHEEYREGEDEDDDTTELDGQFEDASEAPTERLVGMSASSPKKVHSEQEVARSLLELGKPESIVVSSVSADIGTSSKEAAVERRGCIVSSMEGAVVGQSNPSSDEREELIGNPRVVWSSNRSVSAVEAVCIARTTDESPDDGETRFVPPPSRSGKDELAGETSLYLTRRPMVEDDADEPMDLSMPHSRALEDDDDEEDGDDALRMPHSPLYDAPPRPMEGRTTAGVEPQRVSPRFYENISPEAHGGAPIPGRSRSPYPRLDGPIRGDLSGEWMSKKTRPSVLHSYLSEQPSSKRMATAARAGSESKRHRSWSVSTIGGRETTPPPPPNRSGTLTSPTPTAPFPPPSLYGYPSASPPAALNRADSPSETTVAPPALLECLPARLPPVGISSMAMYIHRSMDDGKCICTICNKAFSKPSHLRLHVNIHYFERPFRCDSCAISFRTKGHLQKHKRSVSHYNKVNMNLTFGTPTTDNPRPFKCEDCKIAFRIHGHLAKHLRSKMHIMKLECLGKLPFGTYAEIERSGANLNEIDTTDCDNSLESLQVMAHRLVDKDQPVHRWPRERTVSGGSCDDQSDGLPYVESPVGGVGAVAPASAHYRNQSVGEDGCVSPDFADAGHLVMWSQRPFESNLPPSPDSGGAVPPLQGIKMEPAEGGDEPRPGTTAAGKRDGGRGGTGLGQRTSSVGSLVQDYEDISDDDESEVESSPPPPRRGGSVCRVCGEVQKSAKFLQLHMYVSHVEHARSGDELSPTATVGVSQKSNSPPPPARTPNSGSWRVPTYTVLPASAVLEEEQEYVCELCGEVYTSGHTLKQHMLMHARLRPYICELCDAGFTNSHYLKLHLQTHQQGKTFACQQCHLSFGLIEELERHVDHVHPSLDGEQVR